MRDSKLDILRQEKIATIQRPAPIILKITPITVKTYQNIKNSPFKLERITGIEPALSAWEAEVLPLNYIRKMIIISF